MKLNNGLGLLCTAFGCLSLALASDPYHHNDTTAGVISCAFNANCTSARSYTFSSPHTSTTQLAESVCNQDNCLRQCVRESTIVASFCATYTNSDNTMTTGLPDVVSHCKNNPSRISSACSCLATITPSSGILSQTHTPTHQTSSSIPQETSSSVATSPISVVSTVSKSELSKSSSTVATSTISKTSSVISSTEHSSGIISFTSTGSYTSYSMVSPYSIFSTSISTWAISQKTPVSSSKETISTSISTVPINQSTSIPSMKVKSSIATALPLTSTVSAGSVATSLSSSSNSSSSTTPASSVPTGWVTLPPSDAIKTCAASAECFSAGSIWTACFSSTDGIEIHSCLCNYNREEWYKWVASCTKCVMAALPDKKSELGGMNATVPYFQDAYCSLTDPRTMYPSKVVEVGQLLAQYFESPIEFFNMTVVDQQIVEGQYDPPPILVSITGANSATILRPPYSSAVSGSKTTQVLSSTTSQVQSVASSTSESSSTWTTNQTQYVSSSTSTSPSGIKLRAIASSSSISSPSQTPSPESAFPISNRMQACEFSKTSCDQSRMLFQECIQSQDLSANITAWDCLCTTNFAQWNSTTLACSSCIANALPANIANATWQRDQVVPYITRGIQEYCNFDPSQRPGSVATLILAGRVLTSGFQSPMLWWNMTAIEEPIASSSL